MTPPVLVLTPTMAIDLASEVVNATSYRYKVVFYTATKHIFSIDMSNI